MLPTIANCYYNNAKYKDIICHPLKPQYDGSPDQFIPFLNKLDSHQQDEGWYPFTFVQTGTEKLDLTWHFAKITEELIKCQETQWWTSETVLTDKYDVNHSTYNARKLACLLLSSVTDDFSITIINRIPQDLCNDGPLILWTICNNIHQNNVALTETIKSKVSCISVILPRQWKQIHHPYSRYLMINFCSYRSFRRTQWSSYLHVPVTTAMQDPTNERSHPTMAHQIS